MRAQRFHLTATRTAVLALLASVALLVAGCGGCVPRSSPGTATASLGTQLKFGNAEVYYTPGVDEGKARKVGELLARDKHFSDSPATVQVRYQDRRYQVRFVVRAGA